MANRLYDIRVELYKAPVSARVANVLYWRAASLESIVQSWANYGHAMLKQNRVLCHENNKLRARNERLTARVKELEKARNGGCDNG